MARDGVGSMFGGHLSRNPFDVFPDAEEVFRTDLPDVIIRVTTL
jgi:hypothetical protein